MLRRNFRIELLLFLPDAVELKSFISFQLQDVRWDDLLNRRVKPPFKPKVVSLFWLNEVIASV